MKLKKVDSMIKKQKAKAAELKANLESRKDEM